MLHKIRKKSCELDVIVDSLRVHLTDQDMPAAGEYCPLRACGTPFVGQKVTALNHGYGVYLAPILELTEDSRVKASDKKRMKGYYKK